MEVEKDVEGISILGTWYLLNDTLNLLFLWLNNFSRVICLLICGGLILMLMLMLLRNNWVNG